MLQERFVALLGAFLSSSETASVATRAMRIEASFDMPPDMGQPLGTLFEIKDSKGETICAAGFGWSFSSRVIGQNRNLDFWCRCDAEPELGDLGRPDPNTTRLSLSVDGNRLVALEAGNVLMDGIWTDWRPPADARPEAGFLQDGSLDLGGTVQSIQSIAGESLYFIYRGDGHPMRAIFRGKTVVAVDIDLAAAIFWNGRIYFSPQDGQRILSCAWSPEREQCGPVEAVASATSGAYAFAVYREHLWWGDSAGKIWRLGETGAELMFDRRVGEFYSFALYEDKLIAGYYPTARLYAFDGQTWTPFAFGVTSEDIIVAEKGVARPYEAQALTMFGGRLWIGLYPFGELAWTEPASLSHWSRRRLFSGAINYEEALPYADAVVAAQYGRDSEAYRRWRAGNQIDIANGDWAQRTPSLAVNDGRLFASTGSMRGHRYDRSVHGHIVPQEAADEYGRVHEVRLPGAINTALTWKPGARTSLAFTITPGAISVSQDGEEIGYASMPREIFDRLLRGSLSQHGGLYGPSTLAADIRRTG